MPNATEKKKVGNEMELLELFTCVGDKAYLFVHPRQIFCQWMKEGVFMQQFGVRGQTDFFISQVKSALQAQRQARQLALTESRVADTVARSKGGTTGTYSELQYTTYRAISTLARIAPFVFLSSLFFVIPGMIFNFAPPAVLGTAAGIGVAFISLYVMRYTRFERYLYGATGPVVALFFGVLFGVTVFLLSPQQPSGDDSDK